VIYHIPNGCKFLAYRYKVKKSTGGASHTVQYVEANSKTEINQTFNNEERKEHGGNVEAKLPVVEIVAAELEAKLTKLESKEREKHHAVNHSHRAIVVHGTTTKGGNLWGKQGELEVVLLVLIIVTTGMIIYWVIPVAKENPRVKKWVDEAGRIINKKDGVGEKQTEEDMKKA
jgi:hypothetical protein